MHRHDHEEGVLIGILGVVCLILIVVALFVLPGRRDSGVVPVPVTPPDVVVPEPSPGPR